jgi:hypothetical protein
MSQQIRNGSHTQRLSPVFAKSARISCTRSRSGWRIRTGF